MLQRYLSIVPGIRRIVGSIVLGSGLILGGMGVLERPVVAGDLAWQALPEETVGAMFVPGVQAFWETLQKETRLGRQILTRSRMESLAEVWRERYGLSWDSFVSDLTGKGFSFEELEAMLGQPFGLAFVAEPRQDGQPDRWMWLFWIAMPDDRIDRLLAGVQETLEANDLSEDWRRVDLDLAGFPARQISVAQFVFDRKRRQELPEDFYAMSQEQQQAFLDVYRREQARHLIKIDEQHLLLAPLPGRLVGALSLPQSQEQEVRSLLAGGASEETLDWDRLTDVRTPQAVLARFLEAQSNAQAGGFAAGLLQHAPLAQLVEQGVGRPTLIRGYVHLQKMLPALRRWLAEDIEVAERAVFDQVLTQAGMDALGTLGVVVDWRPQALGLRGALSLRDAPHGLIAPLLGGSIRQDPPAWVPATLTYMHFHYDLGALYEQVLGGIAAIGLDEAAAGMAMADGLLRAVVQADLRQLLASLGSEHWAVVLPGRVAVESQAVEDASTGEVIYVEIPAFQESIAFVWELADVDVWERIMTALTLVYARPGGMFTAIDEQGFRGLQGMLEDQAVSLMLGRGHLIGGFGPEAISEVLALLVHPVPSTDAMAGSARLATGQALVGGPSRHGLLFSMGDYGQAMVERRRHFKHVLDWFHRHGQDAAGLDRVADLLPTEAVLRAALGTSVFQVERVANGLRFDLVVETPEN